jgi:hypothetical protein
MLCVLCPVRSDCVPGIAVVKDSKDSEVHRIVGVLAVKQQMHTVRQRTDGTAPEA